MELQETDCRSQLCQGSVFSDHVMADILHEQSSDFISKFTYLLVLDVAQDFD